MKKFFYLSAILAIVLVSCNSEKEYIAKLSNTASMIEKEADLSERISGYSYHTAYKHFPIAHRRLRRPWIRIVEQHNIPFPGSFSQPPPDRKRHTKPITPLIHQNPFPLIKAILHTGRGNGAGGESKCLYQQYQNDSSKHCFYPYRNTGYAQFI